MHKCGLAEAIDGLVDFWIAVSSSIYQDGNRSGRGAVVEESAVGVARFSGRFYGGNGFEDLALTMPWCVPC